MWRATNHRFKFFHQLNSTDCGAACLCMIANYFRKDYSLEQIKSLFEFTRNGVSTGEILDIAEKIGFSAASVKISSQELSCIPFPVILHWRHEHFLVYEKRDARRNLFYLSDPAYGRVKLKRALFESQWKGESEKGLALILQPLSDCERACTFEEIHTSRKSAFLPSKIKAFLEEHKLKYFFSLLLTLVALSTNWLMPFVFQKMIDDGITTERINVVFYFLVAQLVLFMSYFISDFLSRLTLTKFNFELSISLKKSLLSKLIRLPINFFDTRLNTETLQRIGDQNRIQNFITWKVVDIALNLLNLLVFGFILFYYNHKIFIIYSVLSLCSVLWVSFFLKRRSVLEYALFLKQSEDNNHTYEFIMNMPEIKINHAQDRIIGKITAVQETLNQLQLRSLFLNNYQIIGVNFISKLSEIIIIGLCAYFIIHHQMTLGVLLGISYVVGQLNGPLKSVTDFIRDLQDAEISNQRLGEIYGNQEEDGCKSIHLNGEVVQNVAINNLSFKYPGKFSPWVLNDLKFNIPSNTVTAIVGASGSGKTTLLKLLLGYYQVERGKITLNDCNLNEVFSSEWRKKCGIVLQDGKLFSGTIAENIAFSEDEIDYDRIHKTSRMVSIHKFVEGLPMGYNTKIGGAGLPLSGGQKQRILIARAVYKNPEFIFLDEATSALDSENEKTIHDNLQTFFKGKTVVIVAHRLSTIKNADQTIVLQRGRIVERGLHRELVERKGYYYNLVKNQLELGD